MNQSCQKLKHDNIYDKSCSGKFWIFWIQQKWSFGENLDTKICYYDRIAPLGEKKKNMIRVVLHVFRTIAFSFLSTVLYQSGVNHVLVNSAANKKWRQINS